MYLLLYLMFILISLGCAISSLLFDVCASSLIAEEECGDLQTYIATRSVVFATASATMLLHYHTGIGPVGSMGWRSCIMARGSQHSSGSGRQDSAKIKQFFCGELYDIYYYS